MTPDNRGDLAAQRGLPSPIAWLCTGVILATYFVLMLLVVFAPNVLLMRLGPNTRVTAGLLIGLVIIGITIVVSALYTRWRDRREGSQ